MPYSTTAMPYSGICGANATSIRALAATVAACAQPRAAGISSVVSGPATSAITTAAGTSNSTAQVSRADAIRRASAAAAADPAVPVLPVPAAARATGPARTGTTALVSAPPSTMS